jgi:signal peptidase II
VVSPRILGFAAAAFALIADQISKQVALARLFDPQNAINVLPFFDLVPHWNRGISFGLFGSSHDAASWIFSGGALIIVGLLLVWLWRTFNPLTAAAFGLIIGGALGNVIDRIRFGAVIDFIHIHYGWFDWPVFNLADSFIFLGAAFLIGESLFSWRRTPGKMK